MALFQTDYSFSVAQTFYRGKVRDVYVINDLFISIATDRISAFDHVLPKPIPYKGQVLNQIAVHFLDASREIVPNWLVSSPDPNVSIGRRCKPIMLEMVIRGYLAGHAWRLYKTGCREICGVVMPDGMKEGDRFPEPLITPATKAEEGHDEDISKNEILRKKIVGEDLYELMTTATRALFELGQEMARQQGLILVDTKYEFGLYEGQLMLMDEIHTPDSSRYYHLNGYQARQDKGIPQEQLSKEFVREWLMTQGFSGKEGQEMPDMPVTFVSEVSERYIHLFELITGKAFDKVAQTNIESRIYDRIRQYLDSSRS